MKKSDSAGQWQIDKIYIPVFASVHANRFRKAKEDELIFDLIQLNLIMVLFDSTCGKNNWKCMGSG